MRHVQGYFTILQHWDPKLVMDFTWIVIKIGGTLRLSQEIHPSETLPGDTVDLPNDLSRGGIG